MYGSRVAVGQHIDLSLISDSTTTKGRNQTQPFRRGIRSHLPFWKKTFLATILAQILILPPAWPGMSWMRGKTHFLKLAQLIACLRLRWVPTCREHFLNLKV